MCPASAAAVHVPRARMVVAGRVQIKAACPMALCCTLGLPIPSHDRCAKPLLALFRSDDLATDGRLIPPRPETGRRPPRAIRAQTIRAILFASATRTSIGGLRVSIPPSHVPGRAATWTCRLMMTLLAPMISSRRKERSPIFVVAPRRCLPPVECCLGVRPGHAAKSRAFRNVSGGGARTAIVHPRRPTLAH